MIDISDCPGLSEKHFPMIKEAAERMKSYSVKVLKEIITENTKWMYFDDHPGLRGDSQINVAAARYALELKNVKT